MPVPASPYLLDTEFLKIRWYGFLIGIGMLLAVLIGMNLIRRRGLDEEKMLDAVLWAIPSGIVGARLYYVLFNWSYYRLNLLEIIQINRGGLAIHGGLFAGVLAGYLYMRHQKMNFLPYLDIATAVLPLAQGIGRWGNWFNLEAFGTPTDLPWGMLIDGVKVHPTFLYESILDLCLFAFLTIGLYKKKSKPGWTTGMYLIIYSIGRFFIEILRTDSEWFGPFKAAQVFSVILVLVGVYILKNISTKEE